MQFSIIIPTRNRPQLLARCLESLTRLEYAAERWEVIVVNDGGLDWRAAASPPLLASLPIQTHAIPHAGPAAARNAGAALARGRYLAFTDDDCAVSPDWLTQLAAGFGQTGAQAVGGQTQNPYPDSGAAAAAQLLVDFLYTHLQTAAGCPLLLVANNAVYETAVFRQIGGYDPAFRLAAAEDWEIGYRLLTAGWRQAYFAAAQVTHYHRQTWGGHFRQQFRYGRGGHLLDSRIPTAPLQLSKRRPFYPALLCYLKRKQAPLPVVAGIIVGQAAYRLGKWRQFLQKARGVPETAVSGK